MLVKKLARAAISTLNNYWILKSIIQLIPTSATFLLVFSPVQNIFITTTDVGTTRLNAYGSILLGVAIMCIIIDIISNAISSHDNQDKVSYEAEIQIRRNASVNEALYTEEKNRVLRNGYHQIAYDNNNLVDFIKHYVNPR